MQTVLDFFGYLDFSITWRNKIFLYVITFICVVFITAVIVIFAVFTIFPKLGSLIPSFLMKGIRILNTLVTGPQGSP
ncbi:uncharacterized protein MONOS_16872 [Monocercomonoides exilis]|uniref:uncharacterized protein n=1 Tax=Monocercomonoides exilis TaxID=2049356 RepID=UPI00355A304D|nr:hypothetical protein MONOS_16872 [Monocercomonoides exilis]